MAESISPSLDRVIHTLADVILKQVNKPQPSRNRLDITYGVVDGIDATNHAVALKIAGDPTSVTGISYLGSYSPQSGDAVVVLHHDHDFIVLGALAPEGVAAELHSWAVAGLLVAATLPGFIAYVPAGASLLLSSIRAVLGAGTITAAVLVNGVAVATVNVTTTVSALVPAGASGTVLNDGDVVTLQLSSPVSASDLTLTVNGF